jgi:hypothetical protein
VGTEHYFGAVGETDLKAATLVFLLVAALLILALPRRYAFIPLLVSSLFIPLGQQAVLGGLHFTVARILLSVGCIRLLLVKAKEGRAGMRWTALDKVFIAYCLSSSVMFFLLWGEIGALVNRLGFLYNAFGLYFFARCFVRDERDLDRLAKTFAWVMIVLGVMMLNEQLTGRNVFSIFGGVPEITAMRDGKLRSQGPFVHPLTAGAVGAVMFPLCFGLGWQKGKNRALAAAGCVASVAVAVCSMSSTSYFALAGGWFGLAMWPLRRHLAWFRRGTVAVLLGLHLVMKAPVWGLIARIDLTGSSSSYHRFLLVDQFIRRFGEWWLFGTQGTYNWGWDMWDTINTYVAQGTDGGLLTFVLFIALITVAFRQLGIARKASTSVPEHARRLWILGSMLFAHTVAFWGIGYFDQSAVVWYAGLAMMATAVSVEPLARRKASTASASLEPSPLPGMVGAHSPALTRIWGGAK